MIRTHHIRGEVRAHDTSFEIARLREEASKMEQNVARAARRKLTAARLSAFVDSVWRKRQANMENVK